MTYWLSLVLVGATLALGGCGQPPVTQITVQQKLLPYSNPTNYEFKASVSEVKAAIQTAYEDWRYEESKKYGEKVWPGDGDDVSKRVYSQTFQLIGHQLLLWRDGDALANGRLSKPGNEDDAYLYGGDAPFGESQVYFKDTLPLIYFADFQIHLTSLGPTRTSVEILTFESKVAAGVDKRFSPVHGPGLILVDVAPTTVEEYCILLRIGAKLRAKDMPPLVTPGTDSHLKQITKPVQR